MTPEERDKMLIETHTLTTQVHSAVYGNGRPGLKTRMDRQEGALRVLMAAVVVLGVVAGAIEAFAK